MNPRITSAALALILLAAALTACSAPPASDARPSSTPTGVAPEATVQPSETDAAETPGSTPTCETIVTEGTVKGLTEVGWTPERKDFLIGDVSLPDGLLCFWADFSVAGDHGQLYGWSAISAEDAAKAQSDLASQGWLREDSPEGIYFTEDPQFSLDTDDDGYGMTYLFGEGWVKLADTKQGLILIDWPA